MEENKKVDDQLIERVSGGKEIVKGEIPGVCPECGSHFCGYWIRIVDGREQKVWFCNICQCEFVTD